MKKTLSVLLALALVLACACVFAEEAETCTYTLFNETGEKITELYVTDNATGEKSENLAGEEGLARDGILEIQGTNKEGYVITLSFKTESGYEAAFETLHFETVPISLLAPDAMSGATPISFFAPTCTYTVYNVTGEKITELYATDNATGEKSDNYAAEGLEDGASVEIKGTKKADYVITLSFKTEGGYEASFGTLHYETVPISLLAPDALSGATPISFSAPAE